MYSGRPISQVRFDDEPYANLPPVYAPSQRRIRTSRVPLNNLQPVPSHTDPRDRRGSDDTLIDEVNSPYGISNVPYDRFTSLPPLPSRRLRKVSFDCSSRYSVHAAPRAPGQPLRSALRRSHSEVSNRAEARTAPMNSHVASKFMAVDGLRDRRRASSVLTEHDLEGGPIAWRPSFRHRRDSCMSTGSGLLDPDDPRVTGLEEKKNRDCETEKAFDVEIGHHKFNKSKVIGDVVHNLTGMCLLSSETLPYIDPT